MYHEASLLDQWKLDDWLTLYSSDCRNEIAPTGKADAAQLTPETSLFLVADDRFRLERRVIQLKKPTAHADYPHSRSRRVYMNVRVLEYAGDTVMSTLSFFTFRSARQTVQQFFGQIDYQFPAFREAAEHTFQFARKRVTLDLDTNTRQRPALAAEEQCMVTEDFREAVATFMEKRVPRFGLPS